MSTHKVVVGSVYFLLYNVHKDLKMNVSTASKKKENVKFERFE